MFNVDEEILYLYVDADESENLLKRSEKDLSNEPGRTRTCNLFNQGYLPYSIWSKVLQEYIY